MPAGGWTIGCHGLIVQVCDEILAGQHHDMFPLHVWMTGSGTQFNMNVNEVISNRCCQLAGTPLAARRRCIPTTTSTCRNPPTTPSRRRCTSRGRRSRARSGARGDRAARRDRMPRRRPGAISSRSAAPTCRTRPRSRWGRNGRATPACWRTAWSGGSSALHGVYRLALGGTAVGTGINAAPGFAEAAAAEIARLTGLPFVTAPNKFTVQGAHDALVQLSGTFRTLAVSLYKIANDIRLMSCGPRAGFAELRSRKTSPARRSCRARSIRPSARR